MNQQQWMDRFLWDIGRLLPAEHAGKLKAILSVAWDEAATYNYSCGFGDGSDQQRNDLDAVLRDMWVVEDPEDEASQGYLVALQSVAEHFGLGGDDEEEVRP